MTANQKQNWQRGRFYKECERDIRKATGLSVEAFIDSDLPVMMSWSHGANPLRFARKFNLCWSEKSCGPQRRALNSVKLGYRDHARKWSADGKKVHLITWEPYSEVEPFCKDGVLPTIPGYHLKRLHGEFAHNNQTFMYGFWREEDDFITALFEESIK